MGRIIAYCRVSSRDQNPQLQLDALHAHGYDQLFAEKESGKHGVQRPEFSGGLATFQAGDTLVFWKSDRWGRSAAHVLTTVSELRDRGVTVKSLAENFDLDTKEGRCMFAVLAAAAEYKLELRAGAHGRPRVTGPAELAALRQLIRDGTSVTQAARTLKISRSTAYAALAARGRTFDHRRSWRRTGFRRPSTRVQVTLICHIGVRLG